MATSASLRIFSVASTLLLLLLSSTASAAGGRPDKLDPVLQHRAKQLTGRSRVIVEFADETDLRVLGKRAHAGRRLNDRNQVAEVDNVELSTIAANPLVARVVLDRPTFATLERTTLSTGASLARPDFGVTGKGVGVAVIDSGITNWHDDLYRNPKHSSANRVAHFKDFTIEWKGKGASSDPAYDDYGHGTHVAGIIAGTGYDSDGKHRGVAPGSKIVGLKVMDERGRGYISDVIAAIEYAIAVKDTYNVRVINLSVAAGVHESYWFDPLTLAARRAVDAGIVVVASAGNFGSTADGSAQWGGVTSPGNAPWVLTVGASSEQASSVRSDDTIARFSSRGPTWIDFAAKPDILAPGVAIESLSDPNSTLYTWLPEMLVDGSRNLWYKPYLSLSGTSMAAPVVAGTVALMLEANPSLTPNAVKAILQYTAQVKANESALAQGAGMLNARGAIRLAEFFATPFDGPGEMGDTILGEWVPWARHIIWGNYRISGGLPLPGSNAWALGLRWGVLDTPSGAPVVWGARMADNIVWSTSKDDAGNIVWSTARGENIVWSTGENIVWSTADNIVWSTGENIVWSTAAADNIVWSTGENIVWSTGENIVWSTGENIVWSTGENIVWSTAIIQNVVWGNDCGGLNCQKVLWGSEHDGTVWGTASSADNIVWSTAAADNIVWSTAGDSKENIVWSTGENIVWSTAAADNIVWSTGENIVWSTSSGVEQVLWSGF